MSTVKTVGRFSGYTGAKIFVVEYGEKTAHVYAPNETTAIVAASAFFGKKWTDYGYYSECVVAKA